MERTKLRNCHPIYVLKVVDFSPGIVVRGWLLFPFRIVRYLLMRSASFNFDQLNYPLFSCLLYCYMYVCSFFASPADESRPAGYVY